jgi:hypothetical protein
MGYFGIRVTTLVMALIVSFTAGQSAHSGLLASPQAVIRGTTNLSDSLFEAGITSEGLGAAVNACLLGGDSHEQEGMAALMRAVTAAREALPDARGRFEDAASRECYRALLIYDLLPDETPLSPAEHETIRSTLRTVLQRYLSPDLFPWESDQWGLGVAAMRLTASYALYAVNFPADFEAERFRIHALTRFERILAASLDETGGWLPDSPGYTETALEYLIITAKIFSTAGIRDFFSEPRLAGALTAPLKRLPPQQCPLVNGNYRTTNDDGNSRPPGSVAVLAAADLLVYNYEAAANLLWYWDQCGNPVTPLGVLFIDTGIQPVAPQISSGLAGGGTAIMRHNEGEPDESMVTVSFGDARGMPDSDRREHPNSGDFTFIWRGIPLIVPDMGGDGAQRIPEAADKRPWNHSLVLQAGAGDTPAFHEDTSRMSFRSAPGITAPEPSDHYADGMMQFLDTYLVSYAAGRPEPLVPGGDTPHVRHFLYFKPDALLIWDQVETTDPLEWNLQIHATNVWTEGNVLHADTPLGVELRTHFAGDTSVQLSSDPPSGPITRDLPLIMRARHGSGAMTVITQTLDTNGPLATDLLTAVFADSTGDARPVGILGSSAALASVISASTDAVPFPEILSPLPDLERYREIVVGDSLSTTGDRMLAEDSWRFTDYIATGGRMTVFAGPGGYRFTDPSPVPGIAPAPLVMGRHAATLTDSAIVVLAPDPLWDATNFITPEGWSAWLTQPSDDTTIPPVITPPVSFSDRWEILAAIRDTREPDGVTGSQSSRIRVRHPSGRGFMTLLLPMMGSSYQFDVRRIDANAITFADPTTTWEVRTGGADWTNANLSVLINNFDGRSRYAFDCTSFTVGTSEIRTDRPVSIYYSESTRKCRVMTTGNTTLILPMNELRLQAGELEINDPFGTLGRDSLLRTTFLTTVRVEDSAGDPVPWAIVYADGYPVGATDDAGLLPIRWSGGQPILRVYHRGEQYLRRSAPGTVVFTTNTVAAQGASQPVTTELE